MLRVFVDVDMLLVWGVFVGVFLGFFFFLVGVGGLFVVVFVLFCLFFVFYVMVYLFF